MTDITARLNQTLACPQLTPNDDTAIRHFIGVEGLTRPQLEGIIDKAMSYFDDNGRLINTDELSGKTVMNLFLKTPPAPARPLRRLKNALGRTC